MHSPESRPWELDRPFFEAAQFEVPFAIQQMQMAVVAVRPDEDNSLEVSFSTPPPRRMCATALRQELPRGVSWAVG
jgi:hypothetical protein